MRIFLLTAMILLAALYVHAQNIPYLDSLITVLRTQKEDSNKLKTYRAINAELVYTNPKKDLDFLFPAQQLAHKLRHKPMEAFFTKVTGACYLQLSDYDKALYYYLESAKMYEAQKDYKNQADVYFNIACIYFDNRTLDKANIYTDKTLAITTQHTEDTATLTGAYTLKAQIFDVQHRYDSAMLYLNLARDIDYNSSYKDKHIALIGDYTQLGLTHKHMMHTGIALQYFDSAKYLLDTMADKAETGNHYGSLYNNMGVTLAQADNYAAALKNFNLSIAYYEKSGQLDGVMENYRNMAEMYGQKKEYQLQAAYLRKYYDLKDSLFNTDKKVKMTQLEADYEIEKKNAHLARQEAETIKQKNQRNIFIAITAGVLALLGALALFYRRIRQKNVQLAHQNEQISHQKEELQTLNGVKDRLFSIISHDLRNPLTTLKTYFAMAGNPQLSAEKKEKYKQQTQEAVSQTSNMLDNLLAWANMQVRNTKPAIKAVSIADCIEDVLATVQGQATQKNIYFTKEINATTVHTDGGTLEMALRNILTNAVKYSYANASIDIIARQNDEKIYISVRDNGIGISQEQIAGLMRNDAQSAQGTQSEKGSGLGLFLVKELLQKVNGQLLIESEEGKGSIFTVVLPQS